jgi:hypothetical protein
MLGRLAGVEKPVPFNDIKQIVSEYFHDRRLVEKRLIEQVYTGSVLIDDNGYIKITNRGKNIVNMNIIIGKLFNLDMKNIKN